jgi:hypothetical protein
MLRDLKQRERCLWALTSDLVTQLQESREAHTSDRGQFLGGCRSVLIHFRFAASKFSVEVSPSCVVSSLSRSPLFNDPDLLSSP